MSGCESYHVLVMIVTMTGKPFSFRVFTGKKCLDRSPNGPIKQLYHLLLFAIGLKTSVLDIAKERILYEA